ncbi:hypothetical protein JW948_12630 [bacterium]|nr:hypothetical protein [bacterium]
MSKFVEDLKDKSKKAFSFGKVKVEEYYKIGKSKGEILLSLNRELNKTNVELAETVRALIKKDPKSSIAQDAKVKELLERLSDIEKEIKDKEKDVEKAKKEAEEKLNKQKDLDE